MSTHTKPSRLAVLTLILLLAAAARLPTLTWRSFDSDEGATLYFSSLPYKELAAHFADLGIERHPLLYYMVLKAWRQAAGDSDLLLRLPSALAGMLSVAAVYQIGRRRLGEATAGLAMLLTALNPLVIFQNQEARMYALALLFSTLAVWALLEALDRPASRLGFKLTVFCATITLAAYSHFVAALLFPAMGLVLTLEFGRVRRAASWGLAALAMGAAVYAPYVVNIFQTDNSGFGMATLEDWSRVTLGAVTTLLDFQSILSFRAAGPLLLGLLVAVAAVAVWRGRRQGVTLALWLVPVLALTIFITVRIAFFQTKIFVFSALPLALLMALALFGKARRVQWRNAVPALVLLSFMCYSLFFQWRPGFRQEDFRHAAQFVQSRVAANDSVVLHLSWTHWVFSHYYPGPFFHPFPNNVDLATPIEEGLRPFLESEVLWLVQAGVGLSGTGGDPHRVVENWLAERYPVVTEVYPSGIDVRGYATRAILNTLPESAVSLDVSYPNGLNLVGYRLPQKDLPSRDFWLHPPSTWVPVTLYWSVNGALDYDIDVTVLLEDEPGNVWGGGITRDNDLRAFHPPLQWQPSEIVRWDFDINANAEIPPGDYKIVMRVHERGSKVALAHEGGNDWLILDRVRLR